MLISHVIQDSSIEYEGQHALVVFTRGCNARCKYCHNKALLDGEGDTLGTFEDTLARYITPLDTAVVFCGGEPTINLDLLECLRTARNAGLRTKVFTNGLIPDILIKAASEGILDACSIDFKDTLHVAELIDVDIWDSEYITRVLYLANKLKERGVDVEFRTTEYDKQVGNRVEFFIKDRFGDTIPHIRQRMQEIV